ncbi:hypothetical protein R3W88_007963 [Solanum pinnatisectum]|uniref:Integrase core domain containing protein n=1 Tax=Solanum pinnatisectum TaxID=50273 RepID=A0AAV9M763_9SOLN|nr:hypothetical protein R3W88_007963 [Solanum pinnatisectum]
MATLFQLVRPRMQHAIEESKARIEQWVEHMMDQKVQAIHKHLDTFELRVLERPALTVDVTTLNKEIKSLRADITGLLSLSETEPESTPTIPIDNTVLNALFRDGMPLPDSSHTAGKRPRYSHTSDFIEGWESEQEGALAD